MTELDRDIEALCGKTAKGDVLAGIAVALELCAALGVGYGTLLALGGLATALGSVAPWAAPAILFVMKPTVIAAVVAAAVNGYAALPGHKRKVVAALIGFVRGDLRLD